MSGKINELESQMLDAKLVLVGGEGMLLPFQKETTNNVRNTGREADHVLDDSDSDMMLVYLRMKIMIYMTPMTLKV